MPGFNIPTTGTYKINGLDFITESSGVLLKSPNGTVYSITVLDDGSIISANASITIAIIDSNGFVLLDSNGFTLKDSTQ